MISMSEFKKNPAAVLREANSRPVLARMGERAQAIKVDIDAI